MAYWKGYREAWEENWERQTISATGRWDLLETGVSNVLFHVEEFSPVKFSPQH